MKPKVEKKQTAFRLNADLLDKLKKEARKRNRSLSNYVECILMESVYHEPNETTLAAMKEAESGKELETLDLDNFKNYVSSL
jgi:hypothetical protein